MMSNDRWEYDTVGLTLSERATFAQSIVSQTRLIYLAECLQDTMVQSWPSMSSWV